MKITIEGKEYELDKEVAIKMGVLVRQKKKIVTIGEGDVFVDFSRKHYPVVIVATSINQSDRRYSIVGNGSAMDPFNSIQNKTSEEMIEWLNNNGYEWTGSINEIVSNFVQKCALRQP